MNNEEQERKVTLDHMVDEKFAEIFFLAKEEYDIHSNSKREKQLYNTLNKYKRELKVSKHRSKRLKMSCIAGLILLIKT